MSKEAWVACYERVYDEAQPGTPEDVLVERANEMAAAREAHLIDEAMSRAKETDSE